MATAYTDRGAGRPEASPIKVVTFGIGGMHCAACANRNERALRKLQGVRSASVNFGMRNARVEFDADAVTARALHEAVIDSGFQVLTSEFAQGNKQRAREELAPTRWRVSGAAPRRAGSTAGDAGDRAALDVVGA